MRNTNTLLVVGNGFDIAHGMKTSYKNILFAIMRELSTWKQIEGFTPQQQFSALALQFDEDITNKVFDTYKSDWEGNHVRKINDFSASSLQGELGVAYQYARNFLIEYGNWWLNHFMHVLTNRERRIGNGWVDFEAEINRVITNVENIILNKSYASDLEYGFGGYANDLIALRERFIPEIKMDLSILNVVIEYYLSLEEIHGESKKLPLIDSLENIKAILSYNYTHTYQNVYDEEFKNVCYLHGEVGQHNLVLGTNETLSDALKDKILDCANFKKLYQLIYYRLGNNFKHIFSKAGGDSAEWNAIIYGHSLTPADSYSLGWLFEKSSTNLFAGAIRNITIYYYDESAYNEQLTNLFHIIGQEKVLSYITSGCIEFKQIPR